MEFGASDIISLGIGIFTVGGMIGWYWVMIDSIRHSSIAKILLFSIFSVLIIVFYSWTDGSFLGLLWSIFASSALTLFPSLFISMAIGRCQKCELHDCDCPCEVCGEKRWTCCVCPCKFCGEEKIGRFCRSCIPLTYPKISKKEERKLDIMAAIAIEQLISENSNNEQHLCRRCMNYVSITQITTQRTYKGAAVCNTCNLGMQDDA